MMKRPLVVAALALGVSSLLAPSLSAQIGRRFPSEKKVVVDPVTGVPLTFLTSTPGGDSKIYQTHRQWTADGKWLVFRSRRVPGQAMAVNEETGDIVQLTEKGYTGMLCLAQQSMKLYYMRFVNGAPEGESAPPPPAAAAPKSDSAETRPAAGGPPHGGLGPRGPLQVVELDLEKLFADSAAGTMKPEDAYERVCGTIPAELRAGGDMALDANEQFAYFRASGGDVGSHLPPGTKIAEKYGPRGMGAGPSGLRSLNLKTGEIKFVVDVPFQIGHVQSNPVAPGEIIFCWETGGKAPQRTWFVNADGTGLRPLYPEASYDWVTHEAAFNRDEVAIAILGHRKIGSKDEWGECGTREHPTGLAIVNLRTRETRIISQTPAGSGFWHVNGSPDGRWAVGDDFSRTVYLVDRHTGETIVLSTGHKPTAADHPHPTFNADSTRIEIQSAMLSEDGRSMNICVIPVPQEWLARKYDGKTVLRDMKGPETP